jgi:hypothetical protein
MYSFWPRAVKTIDVSRVTGRTLAAAGMKNVHTTLEDSQLYTHIHMTDLNKIKRVAHHQAPIDED